MQLKFVGKIFSNILVYALDTKTKMSCFVIIFNFFLSFMLKIRSPCFLVSGGGLLRRGGSCDIQGS